tara:strand:+ start:24496 stop:25029 length:534 start_codon:yes stop_codon:yes gene_type:complete
MVQKEQRVGVFVDVQNQYYSAKALYGKKVNFKAVLNQAVQGRKLVRALAYVIKAESKEENTFFDALGHMGFEIKSKDLQIFYGGHKKGDWDVGISTDAIELAPKLDTVVLVSGDGDFIPLVRHLKHARGCRVEVVSFQRSTSSKLIEEVDDFFNLDETPRKFLMGSAGAKRTVRKKS